MQRLIFATNNFHKVEEIKRVVGNFFEVVSLKEAGIEIDIPEPHATLEANASEKSQTIYRLTSQNCFSEDTGLETEALYGMPGVKSARYAGESCIAKDNIKKLLQELQGFSNRKARFRTVISLVFGNSEHLFDGICEGHITLFEKGEGGFGYDPVFIPDGDTRTFAEMDLSDKNRYSHRRKATEKLLAFLSQIGKEMCQ